MKWFWSLGAQPQGAIIAALVGAIFGLLGGIIGPILEGQIRQVADEEQLRLEAELVRQQKIIDAQDAFLSEITRALWMWRYASIRVTYYASQNREEDYQAAWKDYDAKIWEHLNNISALISRSRRLVSEGTFRSLKSFYPVATSLDDDISGAATIRDTAERNRLLSELNARIAKSISDTIENLLFMIGSDFKLTGKSLALACPSPVLSCPYPLGG